MTHKLQLKRVLSATRTLFATAIMLLSLTLASCSGNPGATTSEDNHIETDATADSCYNQPRKDLGGKEFFYIATSTDKSEDGTDGVSDAFHSFAVCLYGSVERGIIRGNGVRNRGNIDGHPAMARAYELGKQV